MIFDARRNHKYLILEKEGMTEEVPSFSTSDKVDDTENAQEVKEMKKRDRNGLRSDMIKKGIQFLNHPNIQKTVPLNRRIDYLMDKGLTNDEIEIVLAAIKKNEDDNMNFINTKNELSSENNKENCRKGAIEKDRSQNFDKSFSNNAPISEGYGNKEDILSQEFWHDSSQQRNSRIDPIHPQTGQRNIEKS